MKLMPIEVMVITVMVAIGALAVHEMFCPRPVAVDLPAYVTTAADTALPYVEKRDTAVEALAYLMFQGVPTVELRRFAVKPFKHGYTGGQYLVRGYARVELSCRLGPGYVVEIPKRGE